MKNLQKKSIFLLLFLLNIQNISSKKLLLDYNEELDFITKDGKFYFPVSHEKSVSKIRHLRSFSKNKPYRNLEDDEKKEEEPVACVEEMVTGSTYWFFMFMVAFLTLFAGMMSGLTVGYLSVDQLTMELRETTGTPMEKRIFQSNSTCIIKSSLAIMYLTFNEFICNGSLTSFLG